MIHKFLSAKRMELTYQGSDGYWSRHRQVSYFVFTTVQASQMPLYQWRISQLIKHIIQKRSTTAHSIHKFLLCAWEIHLYAN